MTSWFTSWFKCADGTIKQPIELYFTGGLFPYENTSDSQGNCFTPRHYQFPLLKTFLPEQSDIFLPGDLIDALNIIFRSSIISFLAFLIIKFLWDKYDIKFNHIHPPHKKWYVIANVYKALVLAMLTMNTIFYKKLYDMYTDDYQFQLVIKRGSALYLVPDIVAMLLVPHLPTTTMIHHITTTVCGMCIFSANLEAKGFVGFLGLAKMGSIYGSLSALAFAVNAYLGLRVVYRDSIFVKILCYISLCVYLSISFINWITHALWLVGVIQARDFSLSSILYMIIFILIVSDDIVLIKWLLKHSSPMANDNIKKQR